MQMAVYAGFPSHAEQPRRGQEVFAARTATADGRQG